MGHAEFAVGTEWMAGPITLLFRTLPGQRKNAGRITFRARQSPLLDTILIELHFKRCPMPRVVPSQVVVFINALWPTADQQRNLNARQAGQISGLVELADQIPGELLTMDSAAYARFICAKAHIRHRLLAWAGEPRLPNELGTIPGQPEQIPVTVIRDALAQCSDETPSPGTSELNFIPDADLRTNLRIDIGAINRALSNGEWKAATILAGSAIEALLLWALHRSAASATSAATALVKSGTLRRQPATDLESWVLHEYIEVAADLSIIEPDTAVQARLAKDFRNLIHPGRAQRIAQMCDRGTALSAVAGVELVVRDLTP